MRSRRVAKRGYTIYWRFAHGNITSQLSASLWLPITREVSHHLSCIHTSTHTRVCCPDLSRRVPLNSLQFHSSQNQIFQPSSRYLPAFCFRVITVLPCKQPGPRLSMFRRANNHVHHHLRIKSQVTCGKKKDFFAVCPQDKQYQESRFYI